MARRRKKAQAQMFTRGEDLPLFSRTPQRQILPPFNPQEAAAIQEPMPGFHAGTPVTVTVKYQQLVIVPAPDESGA